MTDRKTYHAIAIDNTHFFYLCPHEKKVCPQLVHFHGSCKNSITNRIENRCSHCEGDKGTGTIDIIIDENTLRKTLAIRGNSLTFKKIRK